MKKFLFYWEEMKSTFWFIPSLLILLSILLAVSLLFIDRWYPFEPSEYLQYILGTNVDSARSVLSTISGAMISVAGTIFSITLVALTLTSSQFGSRLIKNFMYVRLNQVVLGAYVATYLYCLLVINSINDTSGEIFIPTLTIYFALILAIVNIFLLIVFIHHIANSIQVNKVIVDITAAVEKNVESLFPEEIGEKAEGHKEASWNPDLEKANYPYKQELKSAEMGYLQYLDTESLLEQIRAYDGLLELYIRPGVFVVAGMHLGTLHTKEAIEEEESTALLNHLIFGSTRLPQQDIEFSLNQLVEIAVRALSPGINDPFTANMCIDNLTATVCHLATAKFPSAFRADKEDQLRLIVPPVHFEGVLDVAFSTIRQYAMGNTPVLFRLMKSLVIVNQFVGGEEHKAILRAQAEMIWQLGEKHIDQVSDLQTLKEFGRPLLGE